MTASSRPVVVQLTNDMTLRWSCRQGDFILWTSWPFPSGPRQTPQIVDLWQMRDGDFVTITNRTADLPAWFELHPTEVCDALVFEMLKKLESGYQPGEIMDGPSIWRLKAGDRLVWVGESRPGSKAVNHVLAILECRECALAVGESNRGAPEEWLAFGSFLHPELTPAELARTRAAAEAVGKLGMPRTIALQWALG